MGLTEEEEAFLMGISTSGQYSLAKVAAMYAGVTKACNEEVGQDRKRTNPPPQNDAGGNDVRLLFLDFDGVLHPLDEALPEVKRFCWLPLLESLLEAHPDVHIVIHSTWRYIYADNELRAFLGPLGGRFVGSAPRAPREQAIEMVLQTNRLVRYHLALDDAQKEFTGSAVNLLPLDSRRGISDESAQTAISTWLRSTAPVQPRTTR